MNFKFSYSYYRTILSQIRLMSHGKSKNHYDSLGITPSCTQGEVKSAYYKLSMIYHPDKNKNDLASSDKFRDISEAYEVLGNVKTRRLYDKGLYFRGAASTDDTIDKFHKSRETRSKPPPPSGRTPIYDFDEWSKNHYEATFQQQMNNRRKKRIYQMKREQERHDVKTEKLLYVFGVFMIISMLLYRVETSSYDNITIFGSTPVSTKKD